MNIGRRIRTLALAALLGDSAASSAFAGMTKYGPYWIEDMSIRDALADGDGHIWAIADDQRVLRRETGAWREAPRPEMLSANEWYPSVLGHALGNNIYCLWQNRRYEKFAIHTLPGRQVNIYTNKPGKSPVLFADSSGALWVITDQHKIYRLAMTNYMPNTTIEIHTERPHERCRLIEDYDRRIWLFPRVWNITKQRFTQAILKTNGLLEHVTLSNVPDMPYTFLAAKDEHTLWLGVLSNGLYEVDADTLSGKVVPGPEQRPFAAVHNAVQRGDSWYFIVETERRSDRYPMMDFKQLWQYQNGQWQFVGKGFDVCASVVAMRERPFSAASNGFWMSSLSHKIFHIADTGQCQRIKSYYTPCQDLRRLFRAEGALWALGRDHLTAIDESALMTNQPAQWGEYAMVGSLVADRRRHLWGFVYDRPGLSEWDGEKWRTHPFPQKARFFQNDMEAIALDSQQRLWVTTRFYETAIFDPATETWLTYANFPQAMQAQSHITALMPGARFPFSFRVAFGPSGKICFHEYSCPSIIYYYDGRQWHEWEPLGGPQRMRLDCHPYFDAQGAVYFLQTPGSTALYTYSNGWYHISNDMVLAAFSDMERQYEGGDIGNRSQNLNKPKDRDAWFSWQVKERQLYKSNEQGFGLSQTDPQELHPFMENRPGMRAQADAKGNVLLCDYSTCVLVHQPPKRAPDTTLRVDRTSAHDVKLLFTSSKQQGPVWYKWRMDGGAWSKPTEETTVQVGDLARGKHVIEAAAINRRLTCDPTPARKTVWVGVPGESRFVGEMKDRWRKWRTPDPAQCKPQKLIRLLSARVYDQRERAATELVRRGPAMLPLVNESYTQADADQRWWLEAVRQRLEEQAARGIAAGTNRPSEHVP